MARSVSAGVQTSIDNSERGHALRPAYLVLLQKDFETPITLTTGDTFDFSGATFSSADIRVSRLEFDRSANQSVSLTFSDTADLIKAFLLNNPSSQELRLLVWARLENLEETTDVVVLHVFEGIVDGAEFRSSGVTVQGVAQDSRVYIPRQFVSEREGFRHITKPGTYQLGGQTFTTGPRT